MLPPDELVSLFWTLPPGAASSLTTAQQDFDNLRASRVKRVQLIADFAYPDLLRRLRGDYGIRGVSMRLHAHQYDNRASRVSWQGRIAQLRSEGLDTVVLGVEVDEGFDMRFGRGSWGEYRAAQLRDEINALLDEWAELIRAGLRIVAPAFMYRGHYRDWREGLQPGWFRWWEILRPALNRCTANAVHVYGADGTLYDTRERVKTGLWLAQSLANVPVWLGEVNCDRGTDQEQMLFLVRLLSLLYWTDASHPDRGPWAGSGERVVGFVPFAANGNGIGWGSPSHLIADRAAYELLGRFLSGERFYF